MQNKRIFIEIPTKLSSVVMCTPSIENIVNNYPNCELTLFGSSTGTQLFTNHPNVKNIIIDNSAKDGNIYINLFKIANSVDTMDLAFSFKEDFSTKFLLFFIDAKNKFKYKLDTKKKIHQVVRYNNYVNQSLFINTAANNLKIYTSNLKLKDKNKPILGINIGDTNQSAKSWYKKELAQVCIELSTKYDIVLFGGSNGIDMAKDIENLIKKEKIYNYKNIVGKTLIKQLIGHISSLDLLITSDNLSMHIGAAFSIPTVCMFGSTNYKETSQWQNPNEMLIKKDFKCMPCMKEECPLEEKEYHQCMKTITSNDVLDKIYANIQAKTIKKKKLQKEFKNKYNLSKDTVLILFKARNFKQNGIVSFLNIITRLSNNNFKAIVCGDDISITMAKNEAKDLELKNKVIYINDIAIKTCDIFVLPTTNKKFANNILNAMKEKCVVFVPKNNEASSIVDIFATMQGENDPNTSHKIDALLSSKLNMKSIQKENAEKSKFIGN